MTTANTIDLYDLPAFFKGLGEPIKIQAVLYCENGFRDGFRLVLETEKAALTVTEHSRPLRVADVRDALPILRDAHVLDCLDDVLQVNLRGCF
jgi:hypothetical protein